MKLSIWISNVVMTSTVFSTGVDAESNPNCGWQTIDLDPSSPNYNPNGSTCDGGKCCSKDGFCTSGTSDCQAGCQADFGSCTSPLCGVSAIGDSDQHVCSESACCSREGFCGTDNDACGIGCQYGQCINIPHWIDDSPPPTIPEYTVGACMRDVFNHFEGKSDHHPVCTAKEVHSFTATLMGSDNPTSCQKGEMIIVKYAAGFTGNSAVGRHDIAMYTSRDALCHGSTPSVSDGNCARDGSSCSVSVLGDADIALDSRIKYDDKKGGTDSCADITCSGTFQFAPRVMEIPCEGKYQRGVWTNKVVLQTCFSWRQPGGDINCDEYGAFPGTTAKCKCEYVELDIPIISPTSVPTTKPTNSPTAKPTAAPTKKPSNTPTAKPTATPTKRPTGTPTAKPSVAPTNTPTAKPSSTPTKKPTNTPTAKPTAVPTNKPTATPTVKPTSTPTKKPTNTPTAKPTAVPTNKPTETPTVKPTLTPTKKPTNTPTTKPTATPTAKPTTAPTKTPTNTPTAKPTATPTKKPTNTPTVKPTGTPTKRPTNTPTAKPTAAPTKKPTNTPTAKPTASPTFKPTSSSELGNRVWNDLNANGIQDPGEPGIENVQVSLRGQDGLVVATRQTDSNGYYRFKGLVPGAYSVHFTLPSGYKFTKSADVFGDLQFDTADNPIDGSYLFEDVTSDAHVASGNTDVVNLQPGEINLSLDAGVYIPAKINGIVWHDINANGVQDPQEPGISGATITLYNDDDQRVAAVISDSTGKYLFESLLPDIYYGEIEPPTDYFLSPMGKGAALLDSDFDRTSRKNIPVTIQSGDDNKGFFDAGLYMLASVGDLVWLDLNYNGIQDADEAGFPFPITINLNNYDSKEFVSTITTTQTGAYVFEDLIPGNYELEFVLEEGDIFSPQFKGTDRALDSNVDPNTNKAIVNLISGEANNDVDAGVIADAPYYPDWTFETQVCTNDGFDPEWMSNNEGRIYLYRNKEECCQNHFWWRMTQCMANEQYKFYRNGEKCDVKIDFDFWEGEATWSDTTLFDTKDECCANLFYYDFSGCMKRSPVDFKFDFCLDLASLVPPTDCQTADIYANVIEDAINARLGGDSDANITRVGDVSLNKVSGGAGSTVCGGSLGGQGFINDQTGKVADLSSPPLSTTVCGVISTRSYNCTQDDCLMAKHDSIVSDLTTYVNDGSMTDTLQARATTRLPSVPELQQASIIPGTFTTSSLLLPATISSMLGETKYFKDDRQCGTKTAFAAWETPYDTLLDCCTANFNWQIETCCTVGGGCSGNIAAGNTNTTFLYYPTWTEGSLCGRKSQDSFESWDTTYKSLKECCQAKFDWRYADCCASTGMGGCV